MGEALYFVSVVVPAYNCEASLGQCINALQHQSYPRDKYEIIVVDDGSTDSTALIARDRDVRYIFQENAGPAAARNAGTRNARGEFILFTDSDCAPEYRWIEEMTSSLSLDGIVAVKGVYANTKGSIWSRFVQAEFNERYEMLLKCRYIDMVDTYSAGFRKDVLLASGGFDISFPVPNNEDTELSYRLSLGGHRMVFNPRAAVAHMHHPDTMYRYARTKFFRGYWRVVVYERYASKAIKDSYTPQALKLQIMLLFLMLGSMPLLLLTPRLGLQVLFGSALLFVLSSIPFVRSALKQDLLIGLLAPFLLAVRALSIGSGALCRVLFLGWNRVRQLGGR